MLSSARKGELKVENLTQNKEIVLEVIFMKWF